MSTRPGARRLHHPALAGLRGLTVWVVDSWQGEVRNLSPDEHDQLEWFGRDELPDLDLAHPAYLSLFSDLLAES